MASLWEMLAYLFRSVSARHQMTSGIYIVYKIFILISPLCKAPPSTTYLSSFYSRQSTTHANHQKSHLGVSAFAHMTFARMVYALTPSRRILSIPALAVSTLFVSSDLAAAIVQIVGVVTGSPGTLPEERARAMGVYMGGMGLQLLFTFVFLPFVVKFHRDMQKFDAGGYAMSKSSVTTAWRSSWRALLIAVYASMACVTVSVPCPLLGFLFVLH